MILPIEFTAGTILALVRKGREKTMSQNDELTLLLNTMSSDGVCVLRDNTSIKYDHLSEADARIELSDDQAAFVRHALPVLLREDVPRLDDVMRVFGLGLDSLFHAEIESAPYWLQ